MDVNADPLAPGWGSFNSAHYLRRYTVAGESWDVAVALPAGLAQAGESAGLLIVLDGSLHFEAMAAVAAALERRPQKTFVRPTVVAGIASGTGWGHDSDRRTAAFVPGEALNAQFSELVCDRLIPDLAMVLPLDAAHYGIFGHSFGGVFALDIALQRPDLFRAATVVSPSLWGAPDLFAGAVSPASNGQRILLASGDREPDKINDPLRDIVGRIEQQPGRVARHMLMPDEDHGSVPFTVMPAALRHLYR